MLVESGGHPDVTSSAGAQGLMQIMPYHDCATYDPGGNIFCGCRILADYLARVGGDLPLGLASYYAGPNGAAAGRGTYYADLVLAHYNRALAVKTA